MMGRKESRRNELTASEVGYLACLQHWLLWRRCCCCSCIDNESGSDRSISRASVFPDLPVARDPILGVVDSRGRGLNHPVHPE